MHSSDSSDVLERHRPSETCFLSILHILSAGFYIHFQLIGCIANLKDLVFVFFIFIFSIVSTSYLYSLRSLPI